MANKYLLDANIFVQAKEREYRFEFAAEFWDWIIAAHHGGIIFSVQKVLAEINDGDDDCPAKEWASTVPAGFFLPDLKDGRAMTHYAALMQWAAAHKGYWTKAKEDFADRDNADPFLIAVAKRHGMVVCTHEDTSPDSKRRIMLPDAAKAVAVKTIKLYDLLTLHATSPFKFKP